jgi:hypothetical protein
MKYFLLVMSLVLIATNSYGTILDEPHQIKLTEVEEKFECLDVDNNFKCAKLYEAVFLKNHMLLVEKKEGKLFVLLLNGQKLELDNKDNFLTALEITKDKRFLTIRQQFFHGNTWVILDRKTGKMTDTQGYPFFSPDEKIFVSVSKDLEARYSPNTLDIYKLKEDGLEKVFEGVGKKEHWAPSKVKWLSNTKVQFEKIMGRPTRGFLGESVGIYFLEMVGNKWQLSPSKNSKAQKQTVHEQATRQFHQAMLRWTLGEYEELLQDHRSDGPLTYEIRKTIKLDPDLPRKPELFGNRCIICDAAGDCDAIVDIKFNTETSSKLRRYQLPRADNWSLYSEAKLNESQALKTAILSCQSGSREWFANRVMEEDMVRLGFEKTMRAFRDEKWDDLLPLLALGPRQTIQKQLEEPKGAQEILKTGRVPATWEFNCAVPDEFSTTYLVYARIANRIDKGKMNPQRFLFTFDLGLGRWLLANSQSISEEEYVQNYKKCTKTQGSTK